MTVAETAAGLVRGEDDSGEQCRELAKKEKWAEARVACDRALQADKSELTDDDKYHLLVSRGRVLLHGGEHGDPHAALVDLTAAIALKPVLTGPYLLRAETNAKLGDFVAARRDMERLDESTRLLDLRRQIERAEMELRLAREAVAQKNWRGVAERATNVLKGAAPFMEEARELRRQAVGKMKDPARAIALLKTDVAGGAADHLLLAKLHFSAGDFASAVVALDKNKDAPSPQEKLMRETMKQLEEADRMLLRPSIAALEKLSQELTTRYVADSPGWDANFPELMAGVELRISGMLCVKYAKVKNSGRAVEMCRAVMKRDAEGLVDYALSLAEAHQQLEQHDEAVIALEEASKKKPRDSRLQDALKAAHKAKQAASNPDYYGLLGVPKDATDKQIKTAYRRLAQKFHPDKLQDATAEQKRTAELKMGQINRANDVLSDPKRRAQYDQGFDPENPQGGAGPFGGGGAGAHFFNGGGGGGGGVPFEFILQAMRQAQGQQGGGRRPGGGHQQRQQQQHYQFKFHDEL